MNRTYCQLMFTLTGWFCLSLLTISSLTLSTAAHADTAVGNFPWATLLCKYSDFDTETRSVEWTESLFGDESGQINHYWKEASYGRSSLDGSRVFGWYTLPRPRSGYIVDREPDAEQLVIDCVAAADAEIDFSDFYGINVFTNSPWSDFPGGSGGRGGMLAIDVDGKAIYGFTAIGSSSWVNHASVVHEMGHAFNLLHSNNSDGDTDPYDNPWSVMSGAFIYAGFDERYGALAKHFNAFEKESLGWFSDRDIYKLDLGELGVGSSQEISLDPIGAQNSNTYRMLKLVRGESDEQFFYTVEVRDTVGYDTALPGSTVIIHEVDLQSRRSAWIVDADSPPADIADTNGVMWTPGETFRGEGFDITVGNRTATGFNVTVTGTNGSVGGNSRPFIRPINEQQQLRFDQTFLLYLFPVDPNGFAPDFFADVLPGDSTLIKNLDGSWLFEWTPTASDIGTRDITFTAVDALDSSLTSQVTVELTVTDTVIVDPGPATTGIPGRPDRLLGNVPWVTVLCRFADIPDSPASLAFVQDMFGDAPGQINHWWKTVSYEKVNIDGSIVLGWYDLPRPRSAYISGNVSVAQVNDSLLTSDCIKAADSDVDYSRFYGVNTFFNGPFNSVSAGFGKIRSVLSDDAGLMGTTTISQPYWTYHTAVNHEMGLAIGLPRSNNSDRDDNMFDSPWTNMSDGRGYATRDLRYEYLAKHLNAFEKQSLGWFDSTEVLKLDVNDPMSEPLTVTLAPMSNTQTNFYRAIELTDREQSTIYYTIEARTTLFGDIYDQALPSTAVIAHEVDLNRSEPSWVLSDVSDGGPVSDYAYTDNEMWVVGEQIDFPRATVQIRSQHLNDGFRLSIQTGLDRDVVSTSISPCLQPSGGPCETPVIPPVVNPTTNPGVPINTTPDEFVLGNKPWVTLLCKFADDLNEPQSVEFVEQLFGEEAGQLGHYWKTVSYDNMDIEGSEVKGWYTLPGTQGSYTSQIGFTENGLIGDCLDAADDDVDFSQYFGVSTFFNRELAALNEHADADLVDRVARAGQVELLQDGAGVTAYAALPYPDWTQQSVVAQQMGRGFDLPAGNNADEDDDLADNPWTLMSDSINYALLDDRYETLGKHMNLWEKESLGWIRPESILRLNSAVLGQGNSSAIQLIAMGKSLDTHNLDENQYRGMSLSNSGDSDVTYYIEARIKDSGYDSELPASGIVIHSVDTGRAQAAWLYSDLREGLVPDYGDTTSEVLLVGESLQLDNFVITVERQLDTGFELMLSSVRLVADDDGSAGGGRGAANWLLLLLCVARFQKYLFRKQP